MELQYIEAVSEAKPRYPISLFMAGGISGCRDWQEHERQAIASTGIGITVFNPRRRRFPKGSQAVRGQIKWEHLRLRKATVVSFWFCEDTVCPITLFELGSAMELRAHQLRERVNGGRYPAVIIVGCDPGYARRQDIEVQTSLMDRHFKIDVGFDGFLEAVKKAVRATAW